MSSFNEIDPKKISISYYKIKNPGLAYDNIRWWENGRKYDLLRCLSTLIFEQYQDSPLELNKPRALAIEDPNQNQPFSPNSSIGLSESSRSSVTTGTSGSNKTGSSTGQRINELICEIRLDLWKWFESSGRSLSRARLNPELLLDSALMFYRNSKIKNFEEKILKEQKILNEVINEINNQVTGTEALAASDQVYQILSGSSFVSPNRIPKNLKQKSLPVQQRNPDKISGRSGNNKSYIPSPL
jgi:hypothetical protein